MRFWGNKKGKNKREEDKSYPLIKASLTDVRKAIGEFSDNKREGVSLKVLVKDNHEIDYHLLAPYLGGIPEQQFFMSKETFEIFPAEERDMPVWIDVVQIAVDQYIKSENELPLIDGDPFYKVSYYKLEKKSFLKQRPPLDFYLTEQENMITHQKP
ncbi:DUF3939 domain-containing protein [Pseudalkalibacillus caeni]|uniref:DUF3939 domain-containing protein n=1 Tax=Exobacillus caeni TaxID=2574798 RepID=A0A5R9F6C7_9BACL|nr:DUF3939 domain-containing protein [Pseudalkalibacillus caeni]TLS39117.1 DUF3939 domain-containing protein [Pseudalkalibacillus caeni]